MTSSDKNVPVKPPFFKTQIDQLASIQASASPSEDSFLDAINNLCFTLADYRSQLNPRPLLPKSTAPLPSSLGDIQVGAIYRVTRTIKLLPPKNIAISGYKVAFDLTGMQPNQEIIEPATHDLESNKNPKIEGLTLIGATQTLDGIEWQDVTFINTRIKYAGGSTRLHNVRFVGCTFQLPNDASGARMAEYAALDSTDLYLRRLSG